jgi:hypothetical protein
MRIGQNRPIVALSPYNFPYIILSVIERCALAVQHGFRRLQRSSMRGRGDAAGGGSGLVCRLCGF